VHRGFGLIVTTVLLGLLVAVLYPALLLGNRIAPEASLRGTAPWREQWGPHPQPRPAAVRAALVMAPRLTHLAAHGLEGALWNPYLGGGRAGWLASPAAGGAPLAALAGLAARPGWAFTALVASSVAVAFLATAWVLRRLGLSPWAAVTGALAYTLSGAVTSALLEPSGSAAALGPLALVPALGSGGRGLRRVAAWGAPAVLLAWSGAAAIPFAAVAVALAALRDPRRAVATAGPVLAAGLVAVASLTPRLWLASAAREPGAPAPTARMAAPLDSALALLVERQVDPALRVVATGVQPPSTATAAFVGVPVLLLGLLGLARLRRGPDLLWPAAALLAGALAAAPAPVLAALGLAERPLPVVAFAIAVLAARGCEWLLQHLDEGPGRLLAGAAACLAVGARLLPAAAAHLPFAPAGEATLPSPLPAAACADGSRVAALLDAMPPDSAALLALRDARAADLSAEPAYAAALAAGADGRLTASDALDPGLAGLGVRWLIEPLPLRVVSGEVFAGVDVQPAVRIAALPGRAEYAVGHAAGTFRIGLPTDALAVGSVAVVGPEGEVRLVEDGSLAGETTAWRWWSLPRAAADRLVLACELAGGAAPPGIEVALDRSGLAVAGESLGARIWRRDDARDLATVAPAGGAEASLLEVSVRRVAVQVEAVTDVTLTILVKHRPGLWRATIDGAQAATTAADGVWTTVAVPRGTHRVVLEASLPTPSWVVSAAALVVLGAAGLAGRRT